MRFLKKLKRLLKWMDGVALIATNALFMKQGISNDKSFSSIKLQVVRKFRIIGTANLWPTKDRVIIMIEKIAGS